MILCLKKFNLKKNILKNSPGKCKKNECSLCKSENPLYKNIPSEKNLLLKDRQVNMRLGDFQMIVVIVKRSNLVLRTF